MLPSSGTIARPTGNGSSQAADCDDLAKDHGKTSQTGTSESHYDDSNSLKVKTKTIRVLLDTGSSGDLLFIQKGKIDIPIVKRAVPQSWNTSNGTFQTKKVGDI